MIHSVPISQIQYDPAERQRRSLDPKDLRALAESIAKRGLLQPLVLTRDYKLVAGGRRFEAHQLLASEGRLPSGEALVHFLDELDEAERQILELEENFRRSDLPWQDQSLALLTIHELLSQRTPGQTILATAEEIGTDPKWLSKQLIVAREIRAGNPQILACDGWTKAFGLISRTNERLVASALEDLEDALSEPPLESSDTGALAGASPETGTPTPAPATPGGSPDPTIHNGVSPSPAPAPSPGFRQASQDLLCASFLEWAPRYSGKRFNFLHCDFPYGINLHETGQIGHGAASYEDTPETYWALVKCLGENLGKLLYPSAHLMFWFSMKHYQTTLSALTEMGFRVNPVPLTWHKTDNRGLLPDPNRGPRQITEFCFFASLGDRKIIKAVGNAYGAPTGQSRRTHVSEKSEPMLRHFMSMFVDDLTEMLDPTCGSGSALRAAESCGASRVLGLDLDPQHISNAEYELNDARKLRLYSGGK